MNINRILFTGNLTADPELAQAGKTKVVNAALAGNEFYHDQQEEERQQITTFVDLKIWGAAAENFAKLARRAGRSLSKARSDRIAGRMMRARNGHVST